MKRRNQRRRQQRTQISAGEEKTTRLQRNIKALLFCLLIFLITSSIVGVILELAWMPFIAWMHGYQGYFWLPKARIYAWCKLVPFATLISGVGVWLYERKRIGW